MKIIQKWLNKNDYQSSYFAIFWNAFGGGLFAGQMAFILIFISRKSSLETAGIITIAYAIANLILAVSRYGVRNYQITDTENNTFADYLSARKFSTIIAAVCGIGYLWYSSVFGNYSLYKVIIVGEIIALKLIDGVEDVYLGRYQQQGAFIVGAKVMAIRQFMVTVTICLLTLINVNVAVALAVSVAASGIFLWVLIRMTLTSGNIDTKEKAKRKNVVKVLKQCFPLCLGTTLAIYVGNAPKYMIDKYLNESIQAKFGYIMLPVFVVTLLNQFIYQPFVKELGDLWAQKDVRKFNRKILRQCLVVGMMALIVLIGCLVIGLPLLSMIYNVNLMTYNTEFIVLLLGGSLYALSFYLTIPITTIRMQNSVAFGNVIVALVALLLQEYFVKGHGVGGAAWLYVIMNGLLFGIYVIVLFYKIQNTKSHIRDFNQQS